VGAETEGEGLQFINISNYCIVFFSPSKATESKIKVGGIETGDRGEGNIQPLPFSFPPRSYVH
jgi:hypothetical protein